MKRGMSIIFVLLISFIFQFNLIFAQACENIGVFSLTDLSGSMNQCVANCSEQGGKMIDIASNANKVFIDILLNFSGNKVGLIGYSREVDDINSYPLSYDSISLKNKIDEWYLGEGTCICCGINQAVNKTLLEFEGEGVKSIVVMSDGKANVKCEEQGTGSATEDAIKSACDAYNNYGIIVYAVGFGSNADMDTLTSIANCGLGKVYYGENNGLIDIYKQIAQDIGELPCSVCGNGIIEVPEKCDDGNNDSSDGCFSCKKEVYSLNMCGDNILFMGEERCDDGNILSGDGCSSICDLETKVYWENLNGERINQAHIGETIRLVFDNLGDNLKIYHLTDDYSFEVYEKDLFLNDEIRTGDNAIFGIYYNEGFGKIIGEWTITEEDYEKTEVGDYNNFYFVIGSYESDFLKILIPDITPWCSNYVDEGSCNNCNYVGCSAAENSLNEDIFQENPEIWNNTRCWDYIEDNITSCIYQLSCNCIWDNLANKCNYAWGLNPVIDCNSSYPKIGICLYHRNVFDDCEDRFLEYSWTTNWVWGADNGYTDYNNGPSSNINDYALEGTTYYYDPFKLSDKCIGGANIILCPEQVQLPFFGFYNFIITFFLIVGIYFIYLTKPKKSL